MASYVPGDRVWVYIEGDGWWPARVLSDAEVGARTPGQDIAVQFYAGIDTPASLYELNSHSDAANICYFETSSEKAVTGNPELEASIRHASEDAEANALKTASAMAAPAGIAAQAGGSAGHPGHHHGGSMPAPAAVNRAAAKRARDADDADADQHYGSGGAAASRAVPGFRHLRNEELHELSRKISSAVAAQAIETVRAALCRLDGVDVYLTELEDTKIGIAVGSVLNQPALKPLWPLARAMISFWARHLPTETLAAIRSVQQQEAVPSSAGAVTLDAASPTEPSSPVGTQQQQASQSPLGRPSLAKMPGSPGVASGSAFAAVSSPTTAGASSGTRRPQGRSFLDNVRQLLDNPNAKTRYDDAVIEDVARKLAAEITDRDERHVLLLRLREDELSFVRDNLLTGEWTPKKYLDQPSEVFTTRSEKEKEEQRVQERIKAIEAAENAGLNITALFKCERCGKRHCTFYEQQTRGADEPTTKYVTCLNCKYAWSQE